MEQTNQPFHFSVVVSAVVGTCLTADKIIERFSLDKMIHVDTEEKLLELLEDWGVELCPHCNWWVESSELLDDEDNVVGCQDCR
jgi:hypothetical protein